MKRKSSLKTLNNNFNLEITEKQSTSLNISDENGKYLCLIIRYAINEYSYTTCNFFSFFFTNKVTNDLITNENFDESCALRQLFNVCINNIM